MKHHKDAMVATEAGHVVPVGVVTCFRPRDPGFFSRAGKPHMVEPILLQDLISLAIASCAEGIPGAPSFGPEGLYKEARRHFRICEVAKVRCIRVSVRCMGKLDISRVNVRGKVPSS